MIEDNSAFDPWKVNEHIEITKEKESLRESAQAFSRGGTG